jgi:thiol-disulfide isomerase/thioredoxin
MSASELEVGLVTVSGLGQVKRSRFSRAEKIVAPVLIIIVVWAAYSFSQPSSISSKTYTSTASLSQPNSLPDFTLPVVGSNGLTGQTVTLSSFRGKVILLEFMEPSCPHCQHMAPVLATLNSEYGSNVVVVSVSGPWDGVTAQDTANFVHTYSTSWTVLYDSSGIVFSNYGVQSTPTFFIISREGIVSSTFQGEQTHDTLAGALSAAGSA